MRHKIAVIATGGTIASFADDNGEYKSGSLSIDTVLPEYLFQNLDVINLFAIDSCDMTPTKLLKLAHKVKELANNDTYKAIIITHGTDSMVDSAFFIYLTHKSPKPVIFTGAMRSANAKDFDGVDNFLLALNSCEQSGVFIAMGGKLLCASKAVKTDSLDTRAFGIKVSPTISQGIFDIPKKLPKAVILYSYAGDEGVDVSADIIIYAGLGNGSIPKKAKKKLTEASKSGVIVIIASSCWHGCVSTKTEDKVLGFIASGYFSPYQARIIAMLASISSKEIFSNFGYKLDISRV